MAIETRTLSSRLLFVSMVAHGLLVILLARWADCLPPPHARAEEDMTGVGGSDWGTGVVCEGVGGVCVVSGGGSAVREVGGVHGLVVSEGRSLG